jgi:hypothetical protein
VKSKEENSSDFCPYYVQEFSLSSMFRFYSKKNNDLMKTIQTDCFLLSHFLKVPFDYCCGNSAYTKIVTGDEYFLEGLKNKTVLFV